MNEDNRIDDEYSQKDIPEINDDVLKKKLRYLRERAHETQEELAEAIGLANPQTVSNWERTTKGKKNTQISLRNLYKVAKYYNVSIDWLLDPTIDIENQYIKSNIVEHSLTASFDTVCKIIELWYRCGRIDLVEIPYSEEKYKYLYNNANDKLFIDKEKSSLLGIVFRKHKYFEINQIYRGPFIDEPWVEQATSEIKEGVLINDFLNRLHSLYDVYSLQKVLTAEDYLFCINGNIDTHSERLANPDDYYDCTIDCASWTSMTEDWASERYFVSKGGPSGYLS